MHEENATGEIFNSEEDAVAFCDDLGIMKDDNIEHIGVVWVVKDTSLVSAPDNKGKRIAPKGEPVSD